MHLNLQKALAFLHKYTVTFLHASGYRFVLVSLSPLEAGGVFSFRIAFMIAGSACGGYSIKRYVCIHQFRKLGVAPKYTQREGIKKMVVKYATPKLRDRLCLA